MLLCKECDHRLWVAPFVFVFLRSPFYYFMLPILWTSPVFYGYYLQADEVWRQLQAAGYLQIPMYAVGIAFSLLVFWNLLRLLDATRGGISSVPGATEPTRGFVSGLVLKRARGMAENSVSNRP